MILENLDQCEELCRGRLSALKDVMFSPFLLSSKEPVEYWNTMQSLREHYSDSVGKDLVDTMLHVWLEFLDERQQRDEKVIWSVINSAQTQEPSDEKSSLLLRLQLTWGRVFVFCRYWVNCRNKTIEFLYTLVEALERKRVLYRSDTSGVARLMLSETITDGATLQLLQLKFAALFRRDVKCYSILLRKLKEVLQMVSSRKFTDALLLTPKQIFQAITAFRPDMNHLQLNRHDNGFQACSTIVRQGMSYIARAFNAHDEPHLELTMFLGAISDGELEVARDVRHLIKSLTCQRDEVKSLMSATVISLQDIVSNMSNDAEGLRRGIPDWLQHRDETITCLNDIHSNLQSVAKGVAIAQTVGSSIGVVGGVIGIVGLVLAPFTAGASLLPTAIASGIVAGAGAAAGITATIAEMVLVRKRMESALNRLQEDADKYEIISRLMRSFTRNSMLLLRYIPHDELERSISLTTDHDIQMQLTESSLGQTGARLAISAVRAVTVGGNALAASVSRLVFAGSIAASRMAMMVLAHGVAVIGIALDAANLVLAVRSLFKDGRSPCADELQGIISSLEEEKETVGHFLNEINSEN